MMQIQVIDQLINLQERTVYKIVQIFNCKDLDENTKFKLKTLIQNQIDKLLPKIAEVEKENQSIKSEL